MRYRKKNIVFRFLEKSNNLLNRYIKNWRRLLIVILMLAIFMLIVKNYTKIFFLTLFIILGAVSLIHTKYFGSNYIGFELCTMATVLSSLAYGPVYGAIAGFFSISLGFILSGHFKPSYFISVLVLPIMGLIVPLFSHLDLVYVGLIITILYDAIILPLYVIIGGSRIVTSSIFFTTHVLLNLWIFSTIAPFFYSFI